MRRPNLPRADWLLLGALILGGIVTALLTTVVIPHKKRGGGLIDIPSTFYNDGAGMKAAYLVLPQLGYQTRRLRRTITGHTLAPLDGLVVLKPLTPVSPEEHDALLNWVAKGHRLLIVPNSINFDDWVNVTWTAHQRPTTLDDDSFPGPMASIFQSGEKQTVRADEVLSSDQQITAAIESLVTRPQRRFDADEPLAGRLKGNAMHAFWSDDLGIAGMQVEHGRGRIIILGDAYPLTNIGIGQADNDLLLANLAAVLTGRIGAGAIGFDEFHHGMGQRDASGIAIAKLVFGERRRWVAMQVIAVAALAMVGAAVRFGRPRDIERRPRRRDSEFIEAAAQLLDEANATHLVQHTLYKHYRQRLCRLTHLGDDATDEAMDKSVHRRTGLRIGHALDAGRASVDQKSSRRSELLTMSRALHEAVESLEHGSRTSH